MSIFVWDLKKKNNVTKCFTDPPPTKNEIARILNKMKKYIKR